MIQVGDTRRVAQADGRGFSKGDASAGLSHSEPDDSCRTVGAVDAQQNQTYFIYPLSNDNHHSTIIN
ncbi:hypothetical protein PRIPAC_77913, partial [Pristionchus pacificus]|uniref:Uncharacterized protein n=1 Tax=Pristionchus pacificus TaxID=54126 RepID=A0A2A6CQH9_PRIPA